MNKDPKENVQVCPHCGAENDRSADLWINGLNDGDANQCTQCNQSLQAHGRPGDTGAKYQPNGFFKKFFILFALLSAALLLLNRVFDVLSFKADLGEIVYAALIVLIVCASLAAGQMGRQIKYLAIWLGIFFVLLVGYSYRHDLSGFTEKIVAELIPAKGYKKHPDSVSFPLSSDGHFYIRAEVNGVPITFLADTGASHIVLTPNDAAKLGMDPDRLRFDRYYETANGTVRGSSIRIDDLKISQIQLEDVRASVNEADMRHSLLGMTFFRQLNRYEVKNDLLTLYWTR